VQKERSGHVITDRLAAQAAGRYLKQAAESGYDNGREMYTMSVSEVLEECRLPASLRGCGMDGVIARSGMVVVGLHVGHHTRFLVVSPRNIRRKFRRCKFIATRPDRE
jgi:hypothetical protein